MSTSRDPWLAANLSWSVAGLGQLYAGRKRAGFFFLALELLLWLAWAGWAFLPSISSVVLLGSLIGQLALWIFAAHAAYRAVEPDPAPPPRNPWKSLFFTRFLPGLGHFYAGSWIRGIVLLLLALGCFLWTPPERIAHADLLGFTLVRALGLADAFFILRSRNVVPRSLTLAALVLVLVGSQTWLGTKLLQRFAFEVFKIPASSMEPTLMGNVSENHSKDACPFRSYHQSAEGDRVVVSKLPYLSSPPRRFDVAVFRFPLNQSKSFVKRVIGLPNEELRLRGGDVYVRAKGEERFRIARKPLEIQDRLWIRLHDIPDDAFDIATLEAHWKNDAGDLTTDPQGGGVIWPTTRKLGWIHLKEPADDGFGRPVSDLRLAFDVRAPGDQGEVQARIKTGIHVYDLKLFTGVGTKSELRVRRSGKDVHVIPLASFPADRWCRFELMVLDGQVILRKDGEQIGKFGFLEFIEDVPEGEDPASAVSLGARGSGLTIRRLQVARDIHYLGKRDREHAWNGDEPLRIPEGSYVMMGDNVTNSHDSRAWTKQTYTLKDGRTIVCERQQVSESGPFLRHLQKKLRLTEAPEIGIDGDQNGDEVAIFRNQIVSEERSYSPFIERKFFVGRVTKIWWPLVREGPLR